MFVSVATEDVSTHVLPFHAGTRSAACLRRSVLLSPAAGTAGGSATTPALPATADAAHGTQQLPPRAIDPADDDAPLPQRSPTFHTLRSAAVSALQHPAVWSEVRRTISARRQPIPPPPARNPAQKQQESLARRWKERDAASPQRFLLRCPEAALRHQDDLRDCAPDQPAPRAQRGRRAGWMLSRSYGCAVVMVGGTSTHSVCVTSRTCRTRWQMLRVTMNRGHTSTGCGDTEETASLRGHS